MSPHKRKIESYEKPLIVVLTISLLGAGCSLMPGKTLSGLDAKTRRERKISEQVRKDPFPTAAQAGI